MPGQWEKGLEHAGDGVGQGVGEGGHSPSKAKCDTQERGWNSQIFPLLRTGQKPPFYGKSLTFKCWQQIGNKQKEHCMAMFGVGLQPQSDAARSGCQGEHII